MTRNQKRLGRFLATYGNGWQSYALNHETVETVCAFANLGIIEVNKFQQFRLKSLEKLNRFMRGHAY